MLDGSRAIVGVIDPDSTLKGIRILGVEVLGGNECLQHLLASGVRTAVLGIGGTGDNRLRARVFQEAVAAGFDIVGVVHPAAVVSPFASVDPTAQILAGAHIGPMAVIGPGVIVNTAAVVEHDCRVGAFAHIASRAVLGGNVVVGDFAHVGSAAVVRQSLSIGTAAVIGAGAAVIRDVPTGDVVAGVPARSLSIKK
jgi:UDP-perosamine 4-acetyltransferase